MFERIIKRRAIRKYLDRLPGLLQSDYGLASPGVPYLTDGRVKMMVVEYGDQQVTMLAPLAAKAGDAVDVTHSVRYPNRVVGVRLHGR